ncbi:MAG: glucose-1-phosphate adenylyltransferase subunit GlgD [Butyrivibrio sp.]
MRAIGVILAGGNNKQMRELSNKRAIAAMPMAGSYRTIDFALSNMTNSHIGKVAVITQYNARSLNEHLSSSKWWDFGRKQGGLFVFNPTITSEQSVWYRGTADALYQNLEFLRNSHEPYVVIASGDGVYKLDYNKVLEYHIEKKSDITVVVKDIDSVEDARRFGVVRLADDGRITDFEEKPVETQISTVSTGIYVIRRRLLIELLQKAYEEDRYDFVKDILIRYKNIKRIYAYKMDTYWSNIATVESYYRTNMDFLKKDVRNFFFKEYSDIYTKVDDLAPAKYNPGADVKNSLVASGCIINGRVRDSVIFKKVYIGNNCTINNCIILNDVHIGDNTHLENCIVESRDTIRPNTEYIGTPDDIRIVLEKNDRYGFI